MKPLYLDSTAGIYDAPRAAPSGTGVLLVPPFGWDDQSAYRPRRAWARRLAEDGHAVLRIDLPGTGDSGGEPSLDAWTDAVRVAVGWLRSQADRIAVVALGLGSLVTLGALDARVQQLLLWGAPADGRRGLRELDAFARLEASQTGEDEPATAAGLVAGGHLLPAHTAEALRALDVPALIAAAPPERALLLGRDGTAPAAKLADAFTAAGTSVETDDGPGWGAMLAGPQEAMVPDAVIGRSRVFLNPSGPSPGPRAAPAAAAQLGLPAVRETPLTLPGGAYGVLAEPEDAPVAGVTAVLLNAGAIRHIGPNRMWVEAARRWAERGVPSLRVDLEAIGEAEGREEPYGDDSAFYIPELTAQVAPILDALAARGLPPRFLLVGLCSGSYWAFHAAHADERVRAAVLLNPRLLFWDEEAGSRRELRRALSVLTPSGFRRLLTAERPLARFLAVLQWLITRPFRRGAPKVPDPSALHAHVARLSERGQRLELAFSGLEPLWDELERTGDLRWLEEAGARVHPLPLRSHTLKPLAAQEAAHAVLDGALERTLA